MRTIDSPTHAAARQMTASRKLIVFFNKLGLGPRGFARIIGDSQRLPAKRICSMVCYALRF
ncbi:hypothetical protein [Polaromonas sp. DSR2-3-2]|uniref:hypothetical protein n=1 Tax=unclassified Polaromonas TaxID=2638319 RepID=UPI003CFAF397